MRIVLLSVRSPRAVLLNINFHLILVAIWDTGHYLVTQPVRTACTQDVGELRPDTPVFTERPETDPWIFGCVGTIGI